MSSASEIRKARKRAYGKIADRVENWTKKFESSAILIGAVNGEVLLAGSETLKTAFSKNPLIKEEFMKCVLGKDNTVPNVEEPDEIDFSQSTYRFLRSFISQALQVQSGYLRPRYDKKPCWWPDNIRFISPNHPPADEQPLSFEDMMEVAQRYQQHVLAVHAQSQSSSSLPSLAPPPVDPSIISPPVSPSPLVPSISSPSITSPSVSQVPLDPSISSLPVSPSPVDPSITSPASPSPVDPAISSPPVSPSPVDPVISSPPVSPSPVDPVISSPPVSPSLTHHSASSLVVPSPSPRVDTTSDSIKEKYSSKIIKGISPANVLKVLSECNWHELQCVTSLVKEAIDLTVPGKVEPKTMHDSCMSSSRIADRRRQATIRGKIPQGLIIGKSTGNGNCLYNSVSILLTGEEMDADLLRLSSVVHAIDHFSLYLTKFSKEIKDVAMAHQFIAAVGSSNLAFSMKPFTSDVNELLQFIVKINMKLWKQFIMAHMQDFFRFSSCRVPLEYQSNSM